MRKARLGRAAYRYSYRLSGPVAPAGEYMVKLTCGKDSVTGKLVIREDPNYK